MKNLIISILIVSSFPAFGATSCGVTIRQVMANIVSARTNIEISPESFRVGELNAGRWVMRLKDLEYIVEFSDEENCRILKIVESDSEEPKF